ncbi:MAG: DNA recombination protein RmuC, partial [Planctomycetes bacterium]|nr:DNA recombination protein RmuC [Planctomycetota bacterium]
MNSTVAFSLGVVIGAAIAYIITLVRRKSVESVTRSLLAETESRRAEELDRTIAQLRDAFGALSRDALAGNSEEFLKLAKIKLDSQVETGKSALDEKRKLIDARLEDVTKKVGELNLALQGAQKDRRESFGRIIKELEHTGHANQRLQQTTAQLTAALASPSHRGQWGERMAEDVLRLAGMVEGINYTKQTTTESGTRPDFAFMLPSGQRVNMDVKFPLSNYMRFLESEGTEAEQFKKSFLLDVRKRIQEVTTRDYIDPAGGTVDIVLVFIPNEQVYGFIHEHDPRLLDDAMAKKIVLCSPLTLFAILAVIRKAADNFRLQETSDEVLQLMGTFTRQWEKYNAVVEQLGSRLESTMKAYGDLTTTRSRMLQRPLDKIESLRQHRAEDPDADERTDQPLH